MDNQTQERTDNIDYTKSFLAGLLMGGLAGAGAMLMLAPQSGKLTRALLQQSGSKLQDQSAQGIEIVGDAVKQVRVKTLEMTNDLRLKAEELHKLGQDVIEDQKERLTPLANVK